MQLNDFNKTRLVHIEPYKRQYQENKGLSQEYNALIFIYKVDEHSHQVKRYINIPKDNISNSLLKIWLRKKQLNISDFDIKNPHSLAEGILEKTKHRSYEGFFAMAENKKFINIEDIRVR